jgi:chemotaxis signal transduction protein
LQKIHQLNQLVTSEANRLPGKITMSGKNAWVLDLGMNFRAAVGGRELLHLIDVPATFAVPCTPLSCSRVIFWQERLLPLVDIACRQGGAAQAAQFVAVVGYQQKRGEFPQFGALVLASPPLQIEVSDEQACSLPEQMRSWGELAISCFDYQGDAVPVIDLNCLFNTPPPSGS